MDYIDFEAFSVVLTLMFVIAGLNRLGVFDNIPTHIFEKENGKERRSSITLTEMFAKSQTKYHSLLIMYIMLCVVALMVVLKVLPWQVLTAMTVVLVLLADRKTFIIVKYLYFIIFAVLVLFAGYLSTLFGGEGVKVIFRVIKVILGAGTLVITYLSYKKTGKSSEQN